ncbi:MAG TPA: glucose-1-phosphate adenylyltransferase subunit GlgD [Methylomusa anaerophila]|uniref:Glycogen biosynthesis protein GlgD n=1 Tax=Methylomusa anaerophila TaxID=1930071 RepID=A0A348AH35_9FIRM|nr:glucose-1-phosphate adenylyltransferase subunit GlgD [Methylomusa anaerophila]BBB90383.1 glycogen biosynthesis protein GlgD [Methylomusa anaerophila]HML89270.1 glucose-1-phosphate adenylyltransferase subunit GlgD [Methylomusa anaerophila]
MKSIMGFINTFENDSMLREMTRFRPLAALPFAGRYRLIDFILSNMINSGITNVGILATGNYRSLMDHLRSGKEWDLARKRDGLFILPSISASCGWTGLAGDLADVHNNLDYIRASRQQYVLLSGTGTVCNMDYRLVYDFHQEKKADITVLYKDCHNHPDKDLANATVVETDSEGRITDMEIYPVKPRFNKLALDMYFMERELLVELIDAAISRGGTNLVRDCFQNNLGNFQIYGYPFPGNVARIHSIQSYFRHSMDLLKPEVYQELFFEYGTIYTKVKDEAPAKYQQSANVQAALIANGSVVAGTVKNSILFRGVQIHKNAKVINSIIMQKGEIGPGVVLENVICDKDVHITEGKKLKGELNHPIVIEKGTVI